MSDEFMKKWSRYSYIKAEAYKSLTDNELVIAPLHYLGIGPAAKITGNNEINRTMILAALTILKSREK